MSFNQEEVRKREKEAKERLELISMLLLEDLLGAEEAFEIGSFVITASWEATIKQVNEEAETTISPEEFEYILQKSLEDYRGELSDLVGNPEETQTRIGQTAWYLNWTTFNESVKKVVGEAGYDYIRWITAEDERVCEACLANEGVHRLDEVPPCPLQVNCRCYLEIPAEFDSLDAARDRLTALMEGFDHIHADYMKKIMSRN